MPRRLVAMRVRASAVAARRSPLWNPDVALARGQYATGSATQTSPVAEQADARVPIDDGTVAMAAARSRSACHCRRSAGGLHSGMLSGVGGAGLGLHYSRHGHQHGEMVVRRLACPAAPGELLLVELCRSVDRRRCCKQRVPQVVWHPAEVAGSLSMPGPVGPSARVGPDAAVVEGQGHSTEPASPVVVVQLSRHRTSIRRS